MKIHLSSFLNLSASRGTFIGAITSADFTYKWQSDTIHASILAIWMLVFLRWSSILDACCQGNLSTNFAIFRNEFSFHNISWNFSFGSLKRDKRRYSFSLLYILKIYSLNHSEASMMIYQATIITGDRKVTVTLLPSVKLVQKQCCADSFLLAIFLLGFSRQFSKILFRNLFVAIFIFRLGIFVICSFSDIFQLFPANNLFPCYIHPWCATRRGSFVPVIMKISCLHHEAISIVSLSLNLPIILCSTSKCFWHCFLPFQYYGFIEKLANI